MTKIISSSLISLVALLHVGFMVLEMYFWTKPFGLKTFRMTEAMAQTTKVLAMNQGLYNGFLVAGLVWGLVSGLFNVQIFFLTCVIVAGLFGGATVGKNIIFIQAIPAILALTFVLLQRYS